MIETDGVSCSILMLRNDLIGKRLPLTKICSNTEQYIDELTDYTNIKNKKIVAYDPGLSDILYCVDNDNKDVSIYAIGVTPIQINQSSTPDLTSLINNNVSK